MIVTCPRCETTFSLPDEAYVPGRKARCSQCKNVFVLPEVNEFGEALLEVAEKDTREKDDEKLQVPASSKKFGFGRKKVFILLFLLIIFCGMGYGGYLLFKGSSDLVSTFTSPGVSQDGEDLAELSEEERLMLEELEKSVSRISLEDVRQFVVNNENLGKIVVVSGRAVNNFDESKDLISVEVRLFDQVGKVLAEKQQVAGSTLTRFQLATLTGGEFEEALNNKIDILTNNMNVKPKGSVPFVVVFPEVPEKFYEFEVRPITAKDSEST